ncbi:MAG: carbohydrate kinase [Planctomycetales bacterium]|nr:carbohydrate kinase [Planctomycetales bacterium]
MQLVSIGEVLWDVFPTGARFGGAPANLASHAAMLGGNVSMLSRVGNDQRGRDAIAFLRERGVDTQWIQTDMECPTGTVQVELDSGGHPTYDIIQNVAWDHLAWDQNLVPLLANADAICFGSLGQRSPIAANTIEQCLAAAPATALKLFDVNLRPPYYDDAVLLRSLDQANALKLNEDELPILAKLVGVSGADVDCLRQLRDRYSLKLVAWTRGSNGSVLLTEEKISELCGTPIEIVDTVGAGDSFTATLITGYLSGCSLDTTHRWAAAVAAYVCGQNGAVPDLPEELRQPR